MKRFSLILFSLVFTLSSFAKEGMWIPSLIKNLVESDMQSMGMKLSAEDLYSFNKSSLKDAIVHFNGGCTAEMISDKGLLLTNHHCGYSLIQSHSSLENDYLTNGFWAKTKEQELKNPNLFARFIVRIDDVTESVLKGVTDAMPEAKRQAIVDSNIKVIGKAAIEGSHYNYIIRPFYYGNQYYMFITETFNDVRLVGAPPSSIGKFGFDTDNWVWPRHTGDFSMFRIYADKDNQPAEISNDNVPYRPKYALPINLNGTQPGDFTMIYGFPGRTSEYLTSYAVDYTINKQNPNRIKMRDISLDIMGHAMAGSDKIRIQYAAKQSRVSNAWKKWIGQNKGLIANDAINSKLALEKRFVANADNSITSYGLKYTKILDKYKALYSELEPFAFSWDMFIEIYYYGPEIIRFPMNMEKLNPEKLKDGDLEKMKETLRISAERYFKNYDLETDKKLLSAMLKQYFSVLDENMRADVYATIQNDFGGNYEDYAASVFKKSNFTTLEKVNAFLDNYKGTKSFKKIQKDPAYQLTMSLYNNYQSKVRPDLVRLNNDLNLLNRTYMEGLQNLLPKDKKYYPDANSTLRISYGIVDGYKPKDGVVYSPFTTTEGIMAKRDTTKEFTVPERLATLITDKDYGQYADKDGTMHVCFIASNHTTGGNSGSPALNGNGELIGLNFDRTWESTMSDIMFDPTICRNIMVDIRYVLFIVDKYANAGHLVEEMNLVK
ncbi:MAG: S46 family peptidase [Salibacteraceae bacterium]|nr:S46 family peptidase [Salibacteraceae bacterium]